MRKAVGIVLFLLCGTVSGIADECPGNRDALGTSRAVVIDPLEHPRVGTVQYHETLPLNEHEVVLTFDDGPLPPHTSRILDTLAANCVKATFFIVGRMANAYPDLVRRAYKEGHTIGTHTEDHPLTLAALAFDHAKREIDEGIASVTRVLGTSTSPAPFFRFPGLGRTEALEKYLESQGIMIWSADVLANDWTQISSDRVVELASEGLKRKGKGILLLHDIHERTVEALPALLGKLKSSGFHIVHAVPVSGDRPKTVTAPAQWMLQPADKSLDPSEPAE